MLRRKVRKFERAGEGKLDWRIYTRPEEMPEFYRQALTVSLKTYQERLLGCGLPRQEGYLDELRARCKDGGAIGYLLFLNDRPVAYELSYCDDGVVGYDYVGFDPEYGNLSSGTVLMYLLIQDLFQRDGVEIFDFTEGEGQHKSMFGTHQRRCAKTYVLRDTPANRARVHLHYQLDRFATWVGSVLEKSGLKSRIKRRLRR
jgi:CelD/BcsL family acetyltransferase involved in cellulose biosynthesis